MKIILPLLLIFTTGLYAQQGFVTAGSTVPGSQQTISYSVGQTFYQSLADESTNVYMNEGLQQPFEILTDEFKDEDFKEHSFQEYILNPHEPKKEYLDVNIYPNPTMKHLTIDIEDYSIDMDYRYFITDNMGKSTQHNIISNSKTFLDISMIQNGIYYMTILSQNKAINTLKFIKISK